MIITNNNQIQNNYLSYFFIEGRPVYLCDIMGQHIKPEIKEKMLVFIKSNFKKISCRQIAKELNIGKTTVNRWANELGLFFKKNTVNENYFKKWNPDMTYILGLIFADGNIQWNPKKSYRALTITASEKDKKNLEKIRVLLESTKKLLYSSKTKSYRLIVNSKTMCKDLIALGVTPRKSLTLLFPDIQKKYLPNFLMGVIDGDGTVRYVQRKRSPYFEITISSGSKKFLEKMAKIISTLGITGKPRKISTSTYLLQYSCKRGMQLAELIYTNANLCLERKFNQYKIAQRAKEVVLL